METTVQVNVGWVPDVRLVELDARLTRVNKQARKLGLEPMRYVRTGNVELRVVHERRNGLDQIVQETALFVEVRIHGDVPRLPGGWELLAVVNHEEGAPIVKTVPGHEMPEGQRERGTICDHCGTARDRKDTFILRAKDGRIVQVGRNCLADFLGFSAFKPDALLAIVAFLRDPCAGLTDFDVNQGDYSPHGRLLIDVLHVVMASAACIDEEGWVSRKRAQESFGASGPATADSVAFVLWPPFNMTRADQERMARYRARVTDKLHAEAVAAIEWAKQFRLDPREYMNSLGVCAIRGAVGAEKLGIVVSLIATYRREQAQLRERERQQRTTQFVGEIGKRDVFELTLVATPRAVEGHYGTTYRCEFTDAAGNVFVWWASNDPCHGGEATGWTPGAARKVKATIKKHEEYRGVKTTVLSRVAEAK